MNHHFTYFCTWQLFSGVCSIFDVISELACVPLVFLGSLPRAQKVLETNVLVSLVGGLHHAAVRVSGEAVYRWLKFEGGTHRVQRIPEVGLSSRMQRIHTGTMAVIVLPQPSEVSTPQTLLNERHDHLQ